MIRFPSRAVDDQFSFWSWYGFRIRSVDFKEEVCFGIANIRRNFRSQLRTSMVSIVEQVGYRRVD